ncbi:uncharacterized protein [Henckelia pumila]|uniref:uncharacterized protein n=1 Tax=Henckelia pumila TaxID=405737 RepID=UPI003C6DF743
MSRARDSDDLIPLDLEIESTLRRIRRDQRQHNLALNFESEEEFDDMAEEENKRTLMDLHRPLVGGYGSNIVRPAVQANTFELKPSIIQMIQMQVRFGRTPSEDLNAHLEQFLSICDTFKFNGLTSETVRLRLFPFSLQGEAIEWLRDLPEGSITTWDGQQVETFYYGVDSSVRSMLDAAANGSLYRKTPAATHEIISNMDESNVGWQDSRREKKVGFLEMDALTAITAKLDGLTHQYFNPPQQPAQQRSPQQAVRPTQGVVPSMPPGFKPSENKSNLEDMLAKYIAGNEMRWQNHDAMMQRVETQLGQLANQFATRAPGSLPSDTEKNSKGVNAVIVAEQVKKEDADVEKDKKGKESDKQQGENSREKEDLAQMPSYTKFVKEILSNKRKLVDFETVKLSEECSLGIVEVKPTTISLQLADRSIKYPRGIVEDVLVKVDKFIFPVDFVVLDMEEDRVIHLILGRPFLATGKALIDVQKGELVLRLNDERVVFNVFHSMKYPSNVSNCFRIDATYEFVECDVQEFTSKDPLEIFLTHSSPSELDNEEFEEFVQYLDAGKPL